MGRRPRAGRTSTSRSGETLRDKLALLAEHFVSQRSKHWYDVDVFRGLMRLRGMECRSPSGYAEAFVGRKLTLGLGSGATK